MNISGFFKDGYGSYSATRLAFLLWATGTLVVWTFQSITSKSMPPLDNSVVTLLGILMSGKVVQSFSSNDGPQNQPAGTSNPKDAPPVQQNQQPAKTE